MTKKMKADLAEITRMWTDQKIGNMVLNGDVRPRGTGSMVDPVWSEGKWGLHTVRPNTGTARAGWQSIISHDCDVNGSPYWMLIEYHSRHTTCMYCNEDMPDGIVALFKFHNERMIQ